MFNCIYTLLSLSAISSCTSLPAQTPDSALNEAERLRAEYHIKIERKNAIDSIASDFRFVSRKGEETSLHSLPAEKETLLIFYDPDCDDCHSLIQSLSETNISNRTNVVAIDSEEDRMLWEMTAPTLPQDWTVGFALDPVQEEEIYYISTMPTIYILDREKKVIAKDVDLKTVAERYNLNIR